MASRLPHEGGGNHKREKSQVRADEMKRWMINLAHLEPSGVPMLTSWVGLEPGFLRRFAAEARLVRRSIGKHRRHYFDDAVAKTESFLRFGLGRDVKGVAIYARAGERPFFLSLPFHVAVPTSITAGRLPAIYRLVDLHDRYGRLLIFAPGEHGGRILHVELGGLADETLSLGGRPAQIRMLKHVIAEGGDGHVIVATMRPEENGLAALDEFGIAAKVAGHIKGSLQSRTKDLVSASLPLFLECRRTEEAEVEQAVEASRRWPETRITGLVSTLAAIEGGDAETVVIAEHCVSEPAWICESCGEVQAAMPVATRCGACPGERLVEIDTREVVARAAVRAACRIRVLRHPEALRRSGGVACILRASEPVLQYASVA